MIKKQCGFKDFTVGKLIYFKHKPTSLLSLTEYRDLEHSTIPRPSACLNFRNDAVQPSLYYDRALGESPAVELRFASTFLIHYSTNLSSVTVF